MEQLKEKLAEWVGAGLITEEQAGAILDREAPTPSPAEAPPTRVSLVTEAIGYLGGGLATVAAVIFVAQIWDELQPWAKLAFIGIVTAVLAAAGALIRAAIEPAVRRLASFLWMLSAGGVAFFTALLVGEVLGADSEAVFLSASVAAAAYSLLLWRLRRDALQQLTFMVALIGTVVAVLLFPEDNPDVFFIGLAIWGIGLVWAILSWAGLIEPARVGIVAGPVAMLLGAQVASFDVYRVWGLGLGVATAFALLVAGVLFSNAAVLGLGAVGVIVLMPQLVLQIFEDTLGAPLALLVAGLALLVGAVVFVRFKPPREDSS